MRINCLELQNKIANNDEYITKILEAIGVENIRDKGSYFVFPRIGGDNQNGCTLYKDNLFYINYTHNHRGNLFSLVMETTGKSFPETLKYICKCIGYTPQQTIIHLPFGGFYKNIPKAENEWTTQLAEYSECELPSADALSEKFLKDGIDLLTQQAYGVRYDFVSNSILIPIYDESNRLVGCKARNNDPHCDFNKRWYAYLPYQKTSVVYGWFRNYEKILNKQTLVITESEKGVQQLSSMGCSLGVAVAGHSISKRQKLLIKNMMTKRIIVAFDEGLDPCEIEYEAKKLKVNNEIYTNKVGFIYDKNNLILKSGSKDSPTDHGRTVFNNLVKNHIVWI